ncbi:MAG: hypothetical protein QMC23_10360 [Rubritalea sp.]|jgi:hypothetical protein|tara:strand:- start:133 stop:417 length:285 start_codon:yes stop_codon:yes gene_type:complete
MISRRTNISKWAVRLILIVYCTGISIDCNAQGRKNAQEGNKGRGKIGENSSPVGAKGVVWYATWDKAKAEATRSDRPIFFMTAAYQCSQVPGVY